LKYNIGYLHHNHNPYIWLYHEEKMWNWHGNFTMGLFLPSKETMTLDRWKSKFKNRDIILTEIECEDIKDIPRKLYPEYFL